MKDINILFEDKDIVVAVKPAGILSQEDSGGRGNMVALLREQTESEIFPVHRLDRETAGVMVFAKRSKAAAGLSAAVQNGSFQKEYLAILTVPPFEKEGVLEDLLFFDRKCGKVFPVKRERRGVKKARLTYETAEAQEGLVLVRVFPETGRTHQIRVQFASRKMSLYGDRKYGGKGEGLGLFCRRLSFPHPISGEALAFRAEPEKAFPWSLFQAL